VLAAPSSPTSSVPSAVAFLLPSLSSTFLHSFPIVLIVAPYLHSLHSRPIRAIHVIAFLLPSLSYQCYQSSSVLSVVPFPPRSRSLSNENKYPLSHHHDRDGGQEQARHLAHGLGARIADELDEKVREKENDAGEADINGQRNERHHDAVLVGDDERGGENGRPGDERRAQGHGAKVRARHALLLLGADDLNDADAEEDRAAGNHEVPHGNTEELENEIAEEEKQHGDDERGDDGLEDDTGFLLARVLGREGDKDGQHPDGVHRHEDRYKGQKKCFDHARLCPAPGAPGKRRGETTDYADRKDEEGRGISQEAMKPRCQGKGKARSEYFCESVGVVHEPR
jgi:hypothetical protein